VHFPQRFSPCRYPRATRAGGLSSRVSTQVCTHGPWNSQGPCCAVSPGAKQPLSLHVCLLSFFTITILFIFSNKNKKKWPSILDEEKKKRPDERIFSTCEFDGTVSKPGEPSKLSSPFISSHDSHPLLVHGAHTHIPLKWTWCCWSRPESKP